MMRHSRQPFPVARGALACVAATAAMVVAPAAGSAGSESSSGGALSRTTSAVRQSTAAPSRPSGGTSAPSPTTTPHYHSYYYVPEHRGMPPCYTCAPGAGRGPGARPAASPPPKLRLDFGVQSVRDSDRAASGALRIRWGHLQVGASGTRYAEHGRAADGSGTLSMDVWTFTGGLRVMRTGRTQVWLGGGVSSIGSTEFDSLTGPTLSAELSHAVNSNLSLRAGARAYLLEQDMRAGELRAAVSAAFLTAGYRVFRFSVGPPLHGPEIGVTLGF